MNLCYILLIFLTIYCHQSVVQSIKRQRQAQQQQQKCTTFDWGPCQLKNNGSLCGKGTRKGKGVSGQGCETVEKTEKCRVPCPRCNYQKGNFSKCDPITLRRTRVDTLINATSHSATCQLQKVTEKKCKSTKPRKEKCRGSKCSSGKSTSSMVLAVKTESSQAPPSMKNSNHKHYHHQHGGSNENHGNNNRRERGGGHGHHNKHNKEKGGDNNGGNNNKCKHPQRADNGTEICLNNKEGHKRRGGRIRPF